ncbi:hypothetical protein CONLIGDRAFT_679839 [Coniochaeta ligniaria NRRL 30616]|uniref:Uncharacterized protein n=1 Tax=Coniochaeta ligniaria NRRL 30616 TaxID=1408157 RepID=A0A1J7ITT3_9PEZI|nr:hypothetical protein CONLIGDRAFT_679839 [Coniochaeta ligniaria NRRL 30616]
MPNCYCANYYGSVNCQNMVSRFGERCKLCMALKSGASLSNNLLPEELRWLDNPQSHHTPNMKSPRTNSYGSVRSDHSSAGRSMRMSGPKY